MFPDEPEGHSLAKMTLLSNKSASLKLLKEFMTVLAAFVVCDVTVLMTIVADGPVHSQLVVVTAAAVEAKDLVKTVNLTSTRIRALHSAKKIISIIAENIIGNLRKESTFF
uniref:Bm14189 n=1 Tax=Brugia malayi TaxID=6279 RepID=A0A1I9G1S2_BRUMA|nr:Bm14189 [Brugia malayi]